MRLTLAVLALCATACGGDSVTGVPAYTQPLPPDRASISVEFTPEPAVAVPSGNGLRADYVMTIRENAGLGGAVNFWNEELVNPVTGLHSVTTNFGADRVIAAAGTNRIQARGALTIQRALTYNPGGTAGTGRAVNVNVVVQVTDDNGNVHNVRATARIL